MKPARFPAVAIYALWSMTAQAEVLAGDKAISLADADGNPIIVGQIRFEPAEEGWNYAITWDEVVFANHFLSMRPFRCLEGDDTHWCHVPYPYENRRRITESDLTDLEYDLLFLWKGATEYGINLWNGIYYRMEIDGERLVGHLHEIDMGTLSAPPENGNLRPIVESDLHIAEPESHWLPFVVIE